MKVLMISGDEEALDPKTAVGKRMEEYRRVFGELDILVCRGNIFSFIDKFLNALGMMWQKKYDIITAQGVEHSFLAWMLSVLHGVPWQMQMHTDIFSPYFAGESFLNRIRVSIAKFLFVKADGIRVVSERIKKSLVDFNISLKERITVLPIFVDTEIYKNYVINTDLHHKFPGRFIILMASRITREKNIGLAIDAVRGLEALLLVVGNGPEVENLKRIAGSNVLFEPQTEDLASYFKTCDLFLLTSNYEGYGMTLIEAASAGAKIISSDVGIAGELLEEENIFRVGDKENLRSKLVNAISGNIKEAKPFKGQTKDEYLALYKGSFEACLKKKKNL